ncbi:MAG: sensor histidine kinase [Candidatus Nanopelagicales bacterium]
MSTARGLRWLGPWPLRPLLVFVGLSFINMLISSGAVIANRISEGPRIYAVAVLIAVTSAAASAAVLWLARPFRLFASSLSAYLLLLVVAAFLGILTRAALTRLPFVATPDDLAFIPFATIRIWIWIVGGLALAGYTLRRLSRQARVAEEALKDARDQQTLMLIAEERSRQQIAALLHDRVQAGLITACLQLQRVHGRDPAVDDVSIREVVGRLEALRGLDVRGAARALSPDLRAVDPWSALEDLARPYDPGMSTEISIGDRLIAERDQVSPDVLLACYRIAEQALLNAAVHGQATQCQIALDLVGSAEVSISIRDNGRGLPLGPVSSGFGTAVAMTWCRVLAGSWDQRSFPEGGVQVTASFPVGAKLPESAPPIRA